MARYNGMTSESEDISSVDELTPSLQAMADFLPELNKPDFDFGHWEPARKPAPGVLTMPYFAFSPQGLALLAAMPADRNFDWPAWKDTEEAQGLIKDPARVAEATPQQLVKLTTTLLRADRFTDGTLANAYASGLLRAIVERASALTT
jgi:hypothetical protein